MEKMVLKYKLICIALLYLFLTTSEVYAQSGPGNVRDADGASSLILWLKSDTGTSTTTDGVALSSWNDQSGYGHHAAQSTGVRQPVFYNSTYTINGLPVIRFDGDLSDSGANGDRLEITDTADLDDTEELTVFYVTRPTTLDGNPRGLLSKRQSASTNEAYSYFIFNSDRLFVDIADNARQNTSNSFLENTEYLISSRFDRPNLQVYVDGTNQLSVTNQSNPILSNTRDLHIGSLKGNNSGYFAGDFAEILMFREALNSAEITLIENYLASKYNLTITNNRYAYESTHGEDIFGIGKESDGSLASNTSDRMTISDPLTFNNGDYIMFGHNGQPATLSETSDVPDGTINARLERVWRATVTGSPNEMTVEIDISGYSLSGDETFRLLVNETSNFETGTSQFQGTIAGDTFTATNVSFEDGDYFTLGRTTEEGATGFYSYITGNWEDASSWTNDPTGTTQIPVGGAVPIEDALVTILNGRSITVNNVATEIQAIGFTIENGGTIDIGNTDGHNFGVVSGTGTLRLSTIDFPSGSFATFLGASGGTVNYYDVTGTLPTSKTSYYNLRLSGTGTKTIGGNGLSYTIHNNFTVSGGTATIGDQASALEIDINGNMIVNSGASVDVGEFDAIHTLNMYGNLTNEGTVEFSNSAQHTAATNGAANLFFYGENDASIVANGQTDLYMVHLDKGSDQTYVLNIDANNTSNFKVFTNAIKFQIKTGTLRLGDNIVKTRLHGGGNYDLGFEQSINAALWIDGADVDISGTANALVVYGRYRITAGSFEVQSQGIVTREDGEILIDGGTTTVSKLRPSNLAESSDDFRGSFILNGGVFNATGTGSNNGYARFSWPFEDQSFIMTGGTLNVENPETGGDATQGGIQIGVKPENISVTGGTVNIYIPSNNTIFGVASNAPFYDVNIYKNASGGSSKVQIRDINSAIGNIEAQDLKVLNNLTIHSTNNAELDANGYNVEVGGNFVINNIYDASGGTTIFNGTDAQNLTINTGSTTTFGSFQVNKSSGTSTINGDIATKEITLTNDLLITEGELNIGDFDITVNGNITNNSTASGDGDIILSGGAEVHTISGNGNGQFQNLVLNDSEGATLSANQQINGTLTLTAGILNINSRNLKVNASGDISVTSPDENKMIQTAGVQSNAGLSIEVESTGTYLFPVGVSGKYTPAELEVTDLDGSEGVITVRPVNSEHPNVTASDEALTFYWRVTKSGFGASPVATHTYSYNDADVVGTEADYVGAYYITADNEWVTGVSVDDTENEFVFTNLNRINGEFTAGDPNDPNPFGDVTVYYSRASGDWNTAATWSTDSHGGDAADTPPGTTSPVIIGDGDSFNHTVTADISNITVGSLQINDGSVLDLVATIGHNFGALVKGEGVTGSGRLRISSDVATAEFPNGDFADFLSEDGGVTEYYHSGTDFTLPATPESYNILEIDAVADQITFPKQDITIENDLNILGGLVLLSNGADGDIIINNKLTLVDGTFQYSNDVARTITVNGDLQIDETATLDVGSTGTAVENEFRISGNIVNDGDIDFDAGSDRIVNVYAFGSDNVTYTGAGPTTRIHRLIIDKGTNKDPIFQVNNSNAFVLTGNTPALELKNGTFRLTSSQTITIATTGEYTVPSTTRLWADGGTIRTTGTGSVELAGEIQVSDGSFLVGISNANNYIRYTSSNQSRIAVSGGELIVASQVRRSTVSEAGILKYNQSGGSVIVGAYHTDMNSSRGVLEILNSNSSFTMSGGTLTIPRAQNGATNSTIAALYLQPASSSVSGGTVQIGNADTPENEIIRINATAPVYNLSIQEANTPVARLITNNLLINNDFTNGSTFDTNNRNVEIRGDYTNNETLLETSSRFIFSGASQNIGGTGSTTFNRLDVIPGSGNTVNVLKNITVSGLLEILSGTFNINDNLVTTTANVEIDAPVIGTGRMIFAGSTKQLLLGGGSLNNMELNNSSGVELSSNFSINGELRFTSGSLLTGARRLRLGVNSSIAGSPGASSKIQTNGSASDIGIVRSFNAEAATFTFPIGVGARYTPIDVDITSASTSGDITVKPISTTHPNTEDNPEVLSYYWKVTSTLSDLNTNLTFTYSSFDVEGDEEVYVPAYLSTSSSSWIFGNAADVNTTANTITFNAVSDPNGDFTTGEETDFAEPSIYESIADGNWEDSSIWEVDGSPTAEAPLDNSIVIINSPHTVSVTANGKIMSGVTINGVLDIEETIAHSFGVVIGTGTLRLNSSTFPGGDFDAFTNTDGGTVEFAGGDITLPTQANYNILRFDTPNTFTLPNVDIEVNSNLIINSGTLNASEHDRTIRLRGNWINSSTFTQGESLVIFEGNNEQRIQGTTETGYYNIRLNNSSTESVILDNNITVNNELFFEDGNLTTGSNRLNLAATATISGEKDDAKVIGEVATTRNLGTSSGSFGNMGFELSSGSDNIGNVTVIRSTGEDAVRTVFGADGLERSWDITADSQPSNGRTLTFSWLSSEDNNVDLENAATFRFDSGEGEWIELGGTVNTSARTMTVNTNSFSEWAIVDSEALPVELTYFEMNMESQLPVLKWETATENENFGFYIERSEVIAQSQMADTSWTELAFVEGQGTVQMRTQYEFIDQDVQQAGQYLYRLRQTDYDGKTTMYGPVEFYYDSPESFALHNNYPNPFNPVTTIPFDIASDSRVSIIVYDILGRQISVLVNGQVPAGTYRAQFDGSRYASGVYFVRMVADGNVMTKKMMLVK